ncbi:MAG: hypothetical protein K0S47_2164 [Herbinix sp.]|jgi:hypothetical protein|nr:hypothetical protein [Herbinix sp.]
MVFIKKCFVSLILVLYCFLLPGCSVDKNDQKADELYSDDTDEESDELKGVWIESEYETYKVGITNVRVKWYNSLFDTMMFGQPFILEENINGKWKKVRKETNSNYGFTLEGLILDSNNTRWHTYDLSCYTDGLTSGEYRISASFFRNTLDGNDYGAGNYPEYQVYGYFNVGDISTKRNLTVLDDTKIEYLNDEYHFAIYLPKEWEGLQVIKEQQTGNKEWDELFRKIDKEFIIINLRHPQWTKKTPYQDISFVIFRTEQWNKNLNAATNEDYDLLPQSVPGGNYLFVIRLNPTAYIGTLNGYNEVLEIIGDDYFNSFVHDY